MSGASVALLCSCREHKTKKEESCEQFRNGNFKFNPKGQMLGTTFLIERKDSIQIETETKTGNYSRLSVKWTGPCKYEVKMLETTFNYPDSIQNVRRTQAFKTEILSWTKDYYVFRSTRENTNFVLTDTLWVVR
jgi:hypothetical protein